MTTIFFDLETQKLAEDVGGWANVEAMRLSVGCTHDDDAGSPGYLVISHDGSLVTSPGFPSRPPPCRG